MTKRGQVKRTVRNVDDVLYLITGKRLKDITRAAFNSFGEELVRKATRKVTNFFPENQETISESPYTVLGVNPEAPDFLVRGAYKTLMKKYHPDGETPNEELAKQINTAYDQICLEREMSK